MHLTPNSWGSVLREANDCHEPAGKPTGGQFCSGSGSGEMPSGFLEGSVIKDEVYHGSSRALRGELQPDHGSDDYGIYLSPRRRYASLYGDRVYRVRVNLTNPLRITEKSEHFRGGKVTKADAERLMRQGHDGVMLGSHEIIVFDPTKVWITGKV